MIELQGKIDPVKTLQGKIIAVAGDVYDPTPVVIPPKLQEKTATPKDEVQTVVPDDGYDGLSSVTVAAVALQAKTATPKTEDTYVQPDDGYTGLSIVHVKGDENFVAENIKKDVTIHGITGTYRQVIPATSVSFVKDGTTVTETSILDDGSEATRTITLDEYGQPVSVEGGEEYVSIEITYDNEGNATSIIVDDEVCSLSWEGFD